jgi:uroporphyrinogen-III synthase
MIARDDFRPLSGLRIVVTRPLAQALPLKQRIEQLGGQVILLPLLEIAPAENPAVLAATLAQLSTFECLIFISPNAVRYGMAAIRAAGFSAFTQLKIAAIGQGTAQALRAEGIENVLLPTERFDSEGLLAHPALQQVVGQKIAIFRGDGGRELLGDTLQIRGAKVEYLSCYQRRESILDLTLFSRQLPDAWTISSSEALNYLWEKLQSASLSALAVPLFVPHPRIAVLAQQQGWKNVIQTASGDDGMLSGLLAWRAEKI